MKKTVVDAISSLNPNTSFSTNLGKIVACDNSEEKTGETQPTEAEIDAELIRLQAIETTQAYARNRQADYPDWGSQFNKIYDDGLTKWKAEMVDPVKTKWPKDNSGPV